MIVKWDWEWGRVNTGQTTKYLKRENNGWYFSDKFDDIQRHRGVG